LEEMKKMWGTGGKWEKDQPPPWGQEQSDPEEEAAAKGKWGRLHEEFRWQGDPFDFQENAREEKEYEEWYQQTYNRPSPRQVEKLRREDFFAKQPPDPATGERPLLVDPRVDSKPPVFENPPDPMAMEQDPDALADMSKDEFWSEVRFLQSLDYKRMPRGCGWVKNWSNYYGYGFIFPMCQGKDVFVHASEIHSDPATGYQDLAVGELVYYDIKIDADGRVQATNVTGPGGAYVEGQRGGGIILDEDLDKPPATPKRKGSIRDFTESQFWGTERVQPEDIGEAVPPAPEPDEKWWED